jgi:hypothetical protein
MVAAGLVDCWRCGERILPGAKWDLGHDDLDRSITRGPEHRLCNRRTQAHRVEREQELAKPQPRRVSRW